MPLSSFSSTQFWSPRSLDHLFLTFLPCFADAFAVFLHLLLASVLHFTKLMRDLIDLILARLLSMTDNLARFGLKFIRVVKGTSCTKMIALFFEGQVGYAEVSQKTIKIYRHEQITFFPVVIHRHSTQGSVDPDNEV